MFDKFSPPMQKIAVEAFSEVRPVKIHNVALPPPFIVKQYATHTYTRWDGFFQPNHDVINFQIDVINNNKERRYYGQHYYNNQTFIHDIFHNKRYQFEDGEYQNLAEFHKGNISTYHKMLVEYYIQP